MVRSKHFLFGAASSLLPEVKMTLNIGQFMSETYLGDNSKVRGKTQTVIRN